MHAKSLVIYLLVLRDDLIGFFADEWGLLSSLGVHVVVQVSHDLYKTVKNHGKGSRPTTEDLLGLLVQIGNSDTGSQNGVIGVLGGERGSSLGCEGVQFHSRNSWIDSLDHLLGDCNLTRKVNTQM